MMQTKEWLRRNWILSSLVAAEIVVVGVMLATGFAFSLASDVVTATLSRLPMPSFGAAAEEYYGPISLDERIVMADTIARVKLNSAKQTVERIDDYDPLGNYEGTAYVVAIVFTFDVLEYLKGSGGSQVEAVADDFQARYDTEIVALTLGEDLLSGRDRRWDDREAIVFLRKADKIPSTAQADRYWLGILRDDQGGHYTIANSYYHPWLPDAATPPADAVVQGVSGSEGAEQRFLLEDPQDEVTTGSAVNEQTGSDQSGDDRPNTITLSQLKARVAEIQAEVAAGGNSTEYTPEEYQECVRLQYEMEQRIQSITVSLGEYYHYTYEVQLPSGSSAWPSRESYVHSDGIASFYWHEWGPTDPGNAIEIWIGGKDGGLFVGQWPGEAFAARPLHTGVYRFYMHLIPINYAICDGMAIEEKERYEVILTVTAPPGVAHEAFFDPVAMGNAVGADASNGVLSPAGFIIGGKSVSLSGLKWESGKVTLASSPHDPLTGHLLDFIARDGTVALTLDAADATADGAAGTLTWAVTTQPWSDGDLLLLRLRKPAIKTAYFYPTSEEYYKSNIVASGCRDRSNFATCLDGTDADYQKSVLSLLSGSALRVGFAAERAAVPGKIADARFEVVMAAQSGTAPAGHYRFDIYSGDAVLSSVSGVEAVTAEWTEISVASPELTTALPGVIDAVAFQINGPASSPSLKFTRLRLAVDYDAGAPGH